MKGFGRAHSIVFRLLLAVLAGVFSTALLAERVEDLPKPTDYVSDLAHVLSPQAIARVDSICAQLDRSQANAQIAVVTVHTLDGQDPAEFSDQLETSWKMGRKGSDRGVLILLAVNDHKRRIEVGYGLEGILPDAKLGDIGRDMVPLLRANDFDGAVTLAVGEIAQVIAADAKVTLDDQPAQQPVRSSAHRGQFPWPVLFFLVLFGFSIIFRIVAGIGRSLGWWAAPWLMRGGGWGGGGGFSGGGFGGGGGGGGGDSGFGGFGGGSFGGGGAGGDW